MLEEEALLQAIEERSACPGCGRHAEEDWVVCPNCYTKLRKSCHSCGKLMKLPWSLCPFCGTPEPGKRIEDLTVAAATRDLDVSDTESSEEVLDLEEDVEENYQKSDRLDELTDEDLISQL